jgi:hypothetical protein
MTTRLQLRDRIRSELGDTVTTYLWTDVQLNEWINGAVAEWARVLPPQRLATVATVSGTRTYTLTNRHQGIIAVYYGLSTDPPRLNETLWSTLNNGGVQQLILSYDPGVSQLTINYLGFYALPTLDSEVLEVGQSGEQALIYWVCWHALNWLAAQREKRGVKGGTAEKDYLQLYREQRRLFAGSPRTGSLQFL